jgi:hypothetical protein
MSLLDDRPTNPAKHFIRVKNGALSYYDKESGENVEVPTPFEFIVLDQFATIKGWSDQDESGYWSNEVKSVGKDTLNVRTKNGLKESGIWRDIKGSVGIAGAKYHSSIYVAAKGRDGLEIQNLALTGAALNAWIEFTKKTDIRKNKVTLSDWADAKKGTVKYKTPVFTATKMEDEELAEAIELAKELKVYHDEYFSYNPDAHNEPVAHRKDDVVIEDIGDEPINLDDIPF